MQENALYAVSSVYCSTTLQQILGVEEEGGDLEMQVKVKHGVVRCGEVRCGEVRCGEARCEEVGCGEVSRGEVRCGSLTTRDCYL